MTGDQLRTIMPRLSRTRAAELALPLDIAMREYGIGTVLRRAHFLAQVAHESDQLTRWRECLDYSAAGLAQTWSRFRDADGAPTATAQAIQHLPQTIASIVYAGRLGNGSPESGDGWAYRGGGPLQLTGRAQYREAGRAIGVPLEEQPSRIEESAVGIEASVWWWRRRGLLQLSDVGSVRDVTCRVNGGLSGLPAREAYFGVAVAVLGA